MKKRNIILSIFAVLIGFVFIGNVNATVDRIAATSYMPDAGTPVYAFTDTPFTLFNKIAFKAASGSDNIVPSNDLKKIVMGNSDPSKAKSLIQDASVSAQFFTGQLSGSAALGTPMYTGYSLNNDLKYPSWGLVNTPVAISGPLMQGLATMPPTTGLDTLGHLTIFEALNEGLLNGVLENYKGQEISAILAVYTITANTQTAQLADLTQYHATFTYTPVPTPTIQAHADVDMALLTTTYTADQLGNMVAGDAINSRLMAGDTLTVALNGIILISGQTPVGQFTAAQIAGDTSATKIDVTINPVNIFFDKYKDTNSSIYNHALWIEEHSYPTLSFDAALSLVGVNKNDYINEIKGLFGTTAEPYSSYTDDQWQKLAEDYLYFVTQFAIWKSTDSEFSSKKLGNEIVAADGSSSVAKLDTIYKYYNQDRAEYANYDKKDFTKTITINEPSSDKKPKESGDYYLYGPYSLAYGFISSSDVQVIIADADKTGKSISDENGNDKTGNFAPGEEFYIKVKKSAKVSGVKLQTKATNVYTFEFDTASKADYRGVVYQPENVLLRDVVAGGTTTSLASIDNTTDIVFNPKTGVENVAIVFVITLIAFSLGYLVLNYKNQPVELN